MRDQNASGIKTATEDGYAGRGQTEILQPAAVDRLRVAIDGLRPAIEQLTVAVHALYEQQRVRTWAAGLSLPNAAGMPASDTFVPEPPAVSDAYAPVKAAILAYAGKHGQKAALGILARFNAKSGLEIKPDQYRQALEAFAL
jgi:hypothetical protein